MRTCCGYGLHSRGRRHWLNLPCVQLLCMPPDDLPYLQNIAPQTRIYGREAVEVCL